MPTPEISLAQFNRIASGDYNAGQIDFKTTRNGDVQLVKINNHVHSTSKNNVKLSTERIIEVKEAFLNALVRAGVSEASMKEIRNHLGLPDSIVATGDKKALRGILDKRFMPLTRAGVRAILDKYAHGGRGFTEESQAAVTLEDAEKATRTGLMSASNVRERKAVNLANQEAAKKTQYDYTLTDALSLLSTSRALSSLKTARDTRFTGTNAVNEKGLADAGLRNDFQNLFNEALKMQGAGVLESGTFRLAGLSAKLVKGQDGMLSAVLGSGATATTIALGLNAEDFIARLVGRAVNDEGTLGRPVLRNLLEDVYNRDIEDGLTANDRDSLTRAFASLVLEHRTQDAFGLLAKGNYNTSLLYEIADRALEGGDEEAFDTKAKLDAYHAELAKGNADLPPEMKEMLKKVADIPFEKGYHDDGEFIVNAPIVANIDEAVAEIPKQEGHAAFVPKDIGLDGIKDFVADLVFSDDTMVGDVREDVLPSEKMRAFLADGKRLNALLAIIRNPGVLDTAVAPQILQAVKEGFAKITTALDSAFQAANGGETLAQAAAKPEFEKRFVDFFTDPHKLPGGVLSKFDAIVQTMANKGCDSLQTFINGVFKVNLANANEIGALTNDPYKNMSPAQIKTLLDGKTLNEILDAGSNSESPGQIGFFRQIISTYFTQLSRADKRSAFAAAMRYAEVFDFGDKQGDELKSAQEAAINKFTGAILKGTSPLLQKMLQGLPKDIVGKYADALADMKTHLAPIPRKVVQAHLMKMIEGSNGKIASIELVNSLGAASVGEAFRCRFGIKVIKPKTVIVPEGRFKTLVQKNVLDKDGKPILEEQIEYKDYVVKIMRHDAEKRVKAEAAIFTAAAEKIPGMGKTWEGQLKQYMTEFDFTNEAANVNEGVALYDIKGNKNHPLRGIAPSVKSMKMSDVVPPQKDVMVCEIADGETADSFFKEKTAQIRDAVSSVFKQDPATGRLLWEKREVNGKQKDMPVFKQDLPAGSVANVLTVVKSHQESLIKVSKNILDATKAWFHEALLGSGKFHGDTHSGNLMVTSSEATFIDFGNLYKLDAQRPDGVDEHGQPKFVNEKTELLRVIMGAAFRDKNFILQGFEKLMTAEGKAALAANRAKAEAILDSVLSKSKGGFAFNIVYRLQAAVVELQKLGLELPPQINCFIQSMVRLSNAVTEINTIANQCGAILDAVKTLDRPAQERDELDLVGKAFDIYASEAGKKKEPKLADEYGFELPGNKDVPHYMNFVVSPEYGGYHKAQAEAFKAGGEYTLKVQARIMNAADPLAEADNLVQTLMKHGDREHDFTCAAVLNPLVVWHDEFKKEYTEAKTDEARQAAVAKFADRFANREVNMLQCLYTGYLNLEEMKFKEPKTFATAITSILLGSFDALSKSLTKEEGESLKRDVGWIAKFELGVGFWDLLDEDKVLDAIKRDAQAMGGDNDYKVDIGI